MNKVRAISYLNHFILSIVNCITNDKGGIYMAIGSTNSSMNTKIQEDIEALQNPEFTEASNRSNINSGESHTTILGKIKKYFTDLKSHAFNDPVNNLTSTTTGKALDAYQGKVLDDKKIDKSWKKLNIGAHANTKYDISNLEEGTELFIVVTAPYSDNEIVEFSKRFIVGYDTPPASSTNLTSVSIGSCYSPIPIPDNHNTSHYQSCALNMQNNEIQCVSIMINGTEFISNVSSRIYIFYR